MFVAYAKDGWGEKKGLILCVGGGGVKEAVMKVLIDSIHAEGMVGSFVVVVRRETRLILMLMNQETTIG